LPFGSDGRKHTNFTLDLIFTSLQQIISAVVTAIFQVPLDVITAFLTSIFVPSM
jgi:hypothetical protein